MNLDLKPINLTFIKEGHSHVLNGCPVPGCTSISSLFTDDGWKFAWPVKLMEEELIAWWRELAIPCTNNGFREAVRTAKNAWRRKRDKSKDSGTRAHAWIETYLKEGTDTAFLEDKDAMNCIGNFLQWEQETKPTWLASELQVGSETHNFAGILDAIAIINGKTLLIDFKTGKDIKPEFSIQLAGLQICLEEQGVKIDGRAILLLPKQGSFKFEAITSDCEGDKRAFLAGLEFYHHLSFFKSRNRHEFSR